MKKKMTLAVMALAVSAMAGSAFAANEVPMKKAEMPVQTDMATQIQAQPIVSLEQITKEKGISVYDKAGNTSKTVPMKKIIDLEQMAKEKGITVEELIAQLAKEGKITKAVPAKPADKK